MAVTGVPRPQRDHAVIMARFARDCLYKMNTLFHKLELPLGPGTAELSMRFGLHSGPVTGGVVRGENARFQLFGDTVNTAARMESTGERGRIQLSEETANLLKKAGKGHWIEPREDKVFAKGKGEMSTFWLKLSTSVDTTSGHSSGHSTGHSSIHDSSNGEVDELKERLLSMESEKLARLVDWNAKVLMRLLKQIVTRRQAQGRKTLTVKAWSELEKKLRSKRGTMVLDEVREMIELPHCDHKSEEQIQDADTMELSPLVEEQVKSLVQGIASMYRSNPFHNFEHASHGNSIELFEKYNQLVPVSLTNIFLSFLQSSCLSPNCSLASSLRRSWR